MSRRLNRLTFPIALCLGGSFGCGSPDDVVNARLSSSGGTVSVTRPSGGAPAAASGGWASGGALTSRGGESGGGATTSVAGASAGATTNGGGASAGAASTASADLPCDVRDLAKAKCGICHGASTQFGAPYSLVRAADFRAHGSVIMQRIADDTRPMPPVPNERLTAEERSVLENYVKAGAPAGNCTLPEPKSDSGTSGSKPRDPDVTCYKITSRASKSGQKYQVPMTPDLYHCFDYAFPWGSKAVQIVSARPITDNSKVLHHWILYNVDSPVTDGNSSDCIGAHPNAAMVTGWAPGGQALETPPDVGIGVMPGGFVLETHYNNTVDGNQQDASGAEVCVTEKLRKNTAGVHWLGTQALNKAVAKGTCVPTATQDVTILSSTPHMHLQGRHMKTVINRAGGGSEVLIDKPFDFNNQVSYSTRAVVNKGDTLTTTCTYATPTPFGEGTNQEMCYNFVLAYPSGGLAQAFQLLRKNDCSGFDL